MNSPVAHWEIAGPDAAALREFYAKAFGWTITTAGPEYSLVDTGDGGIGGGIRQSAQDMPGVTVYIRVDDLPGAIATVRALGAELIVPPTSVERTMAFAMFRDPAGNAVGMLTESR